MTATSTVGRGRHRWTPLSAGPATRRAAAPAPTTWLRVVRTAKVLTILFAWLIVASVAVRSAPKGPVFCAGPVKCAASAEATASTAAPQ